MSTTYIPIEASPCTIASLQALEAFKLGYNVYNLATKKALHKPCQHNSSLAQLVPELGAVIDQSPDLVALVASSVLGTHPPWKDFGSF